MRRLSMLAVTAALIAPLPAAAQEWREPPAENVMVVDTTKGRIIFEMFPDVAPQHVERLQTLTRQGFYDGIKFHRVLSGTMAQTGDPLGTGAGGSDLPDLPAEFAFRRGRSPMFAVVPNAGQGVFGLYGGLPVLTQPDAQMMITTDAKVPATVRFCPGVVAMARANSPDSANSQFFLMTGERTQLNDSYSAFGRVLAGLDVVRGLNSGPPEEDGRVANPDVMTRVRLLADIPEAERPTVRVAMPGSPAWAAAVEAGRVAATGRIHICNVQIPAEATGP